MIGVAPGACLRRHFDKGPHATVIPASISKAKIPRSLGRLKINDLYSLALISLSLASDKVCFNYEFVIPSSVVSLAADLLKAALFLLLNQPAFDI